MDCFSYHPVLWRTESSALIDPLTLPHWDALVQSADSYSFFHSSCWLKVLADTYGYQNLALVVKQRGSLKALLPISEITSRWTGKRGVSLPFSDLCYPLAYGGTGQIHDLVQDILRYGREAGWKYFELRGGQHSASGKDDSLYYHHELSLDGHENEIFNCLSENHRRNVRKSCCSGIEVRFSISTSALRQFYRLHCRNRRQLGLPPQPFSFFQKIQEHILQSGHGMVILAYQGSKAIAAQVFFHFGRVAIYKYGASDSAYLSLRPNHRIMWEAILWYRRRDYRCISFGRTDLTDAGLARYKRGWGAQQEVISYHRYTLSGSIPKLRNAATNSLLILRHVPVPVLQLIGKCCYRHFG